MDYQFRKLTSTFQPKLETPPSEQLSGSSFACTQESYATVDGVPMKFYHCFDGDAKTHWRINNVDTSKWYWAKLYIPDAVTPVSFSITAPVTGGAPAKVRLFAGINDSSYDPVSEEVVVTDVSKAIELDIKPTSKVYKYLKLEVMPSTQDALVVMHITYRCVHIDMFNVNFVNEHKELIPLVSYMKD